MELNGISDLPELESGCWPQNVGILALELYFPKCYVEQRELELYDIGQSKQPWTPGKYTEGLGQERIGFCSDREDVNSLCLTVTKRLMDAYKISQHDIGCLEVGTETLVDKSKSVKSVLMQLFPENADIEGLDSKNACFGGTQALFNAVNWVESSSYDGRYALVVMGDVATYAQGPARCTGGAGAMALLIGADAPLTFDRRLRSLHVRHRYDFYKPRGHSEYPQVPRGGALSLASYLSSLAHCYALYRAKAKRLYGAHVSLESFDAVLFHSPFAKLVQKAFAVLYFIDYCNKSQAIGDENNGNEKFRSMAIDDLLNNDAGDADIERRNRQFLKEAVDTSSTAFGVKTHPLLLFPRNVGNMYTPTLYSQLCAFLLSKPLAELWGNRLLLYSYGSGSAAAVFSLSFRCADNISTSASKWLSLMIDRSKDAKMRLLEQRTKLEPMRFHHCLLLREQLIAADVPYTPQGRVDTESIFPGTYYLSDIDSEYRRVYGKL